MPSRRYTLVISNTRTEHEHHVSLRPGRILLGVVACFCLPVLVGFGTVFRSHAEIAGLTATQAMLQFENANFRGATAALTTQLETLQGALQEIGASAALDPQLLKTMERLPAAVKSRAMGGPSTAATLAAITPGLSSPESTFALLRDLLKGLETRLRDLRSDVEKRNQLAAATPSIWPAHGAMTSAVGPRLDPFTGNPDFHEGLDIAAQHGSPVYATADGTVTHAAASGAYGKLVTLDHGYGLETRYGHLASMQVQAGATVHRGDIVGTVGSTGRSTGSHLHYEIRVNERLLNPLRLLSAPRASRSF